MGKIPTIRILDVEAINKAAVAKTSFPASGLAYKYIVCQINFNEIVLLLYMNAQNKNKKNLPMTKLYKHQHLLAEFHRKILSNSILQ